MELKVHLMIIKFCFLMLLVIAFTSLSAQNPDTPENYSLEKKLDSIFSSFNSKTPGVAVAVLQNGKLIAKKAYGMASLEHNAPFTHNTVVRLPYSEGREFISIAAVIMEQDGFISLEDKVRKYFPQLPSWSEPVTIYDLLNHRSGFVDEWATLLLSQASMTNRFDESQFLDLLYRQPKPEVEPGKGYMYCNSDFGLLRLILEKASGQNLRQWMKTNMFDSLQMKSSTLHDDKDEVIPGFAPEYFSNGKIYKKWTSDKTSPGGNYYIATSVNDLQKWAAAHTDQNSKIAKAVSKLFIKAQLMPGKEKNYVFGYKVKSLDKYQVFAHQGVSERTYISSVKDKDITVILLANVMEASSPYHEMIMAYLLDMKKQTFINKSFKKESVKYSPEKLKAFTGIYIEADTVTYESFTKKRKEAVELRIINDSLKIKFGNEIFPLEYITWGVFKDLDYPVYLEFSKNKVDSNKLLAHIHHDNKVMELVKDRSLLWQPKKEELQNFLGKYYSPHLGVYWTIVMDDKNKLVLKRSAIADTELNPHINEEFSIRIDKFSEVGFNSSVKFYVDEKGSVTHLIVHDSRLMGHQFYKIQ